MRLTPIDASKCVCGPGPTGGAYSALPDPIAEFGEGGPGPTGGAYSALPDPIAEFGEGE